MEKAIIISTDVYLDLGYDDREEFVQALKGMHERGNLICFISKDRKLLKEIETDVDFAKYVTRTHIRTVIQTNSDKQNLFVVIGNKDQDFFLSNNFRILLYYPTWAESIDPRVVKYGNPIISIEQFEQVIEVLNNQNNWFYTLELPDKSMVYSLMSAHYKYGYIPEKEKELVVGFERLLKEGKKDYYKVLYTHFMASMSNNPDFRDVDIFAIFPSSGKAYNDDLMRFKEAVRTTMGIHNPPAIENGTSPNNLFIRHTSINKSHYLSREKRRELGCSRHLDTVMLNDAYRGRLEGKSVCVFDDYLTHGNSFETARNLLYKQKVKKVICVSIGKFDNPYLFQEYKIVGDVFTPNFTYELKAEQEIYGGTREHKARKEVENLHDIFRL